MKKLVLLLLFLSAYRVQAQIQPEAEQTDTLSTACKKVNTVIDSLKSQPKYERITHIVEEMAVGYKKFNKISLGPLPHVYANNNVEGHRFLFGLKTNGDFSDKWELSGYGAFGTVDKRLKFSGKVRYIFNRERWSEVAFSHRNDIQRLGLMSDKFGESPYLTGYARFGNLRFPFTTEETSLFWKRDVLPGLTQTVGMSSRVYTPLYDFGYYSQAGEHESLVHRFKTTELSVAARYSKNQAYAIEENDRQALDNGSSPVYNFKYTFGLIKTIGGGSSYQRIDVGVSQHFAAGELGKAFYRLEAGKIFSPVPYPLLEVHLGNETPFYNRQSFNLMDFFEFSSDTYSSLHYEQHMEKLLYRPLPFLKKLDWRLLTTANVLYGGLSTHNRRVLSPFGVNGTLQPTFNTLEGKPYVEVGYGIGNILGFLRIDAFHRLTYTHQPNTRKFGVKFSASLKL